LSRKAQEKALLYRWCPGSKIKPISYKFTNMMEKYIDSDKRRDFKRA